MQDTKLPVVRKNLTTELSIYKQELIELRVRIAGIDHTKLSKGWVVEQLDDLISHIKGEDKLNEGKK